MSLSSLCRQSGAAAHRRGRQGLLACARLRLMTDTRGLTTLEYLAVIALILLVTLGTMRLLSRTISSEAQGQVDALLALDWTSRDGSRANTGARGNARGLPAAPSVFAIGVPAGDGAGPVPVQAASDAVRRAIDAGRDFAGDAVDRAKDVAGGAVDRAKDFAGD